MKLFLVLLLFSSNLYAVDLKGRGSSIAVKVPKPELYPGEDMVEMFDKDLTQNMGFTIWPENSTFPSNNLKISIYKNDVAAGVYTIQGLDAKEAEALVRNAALLNAYIVNGATINLPANASAKDFSKAVTELENSNNPKILKAKIKMLEQQLEKFATIASRNNDKCKVRLKHLPKDDREENSDSKASK